MILSFARSLPRLIKPSCLSSIRPVIRPPSLLKISYPFSTSSPPPSPPPPSSPQYQKLKQDSKTFYETSVQKIHQLSSIQQWRTLIQQSPDPVVLDLYADWCGPCKQLTPLLQKQATKDGTWRLVKINIDKFPQIASQLQIKSVPTVILIANRQFVDAFSGYPDEATLARFMGTLRKSLDSGFLETTRLQNEYLKGLEKARELLIGREYEGAERMIREVLPGIDVALQPLAQLMLAHAIIEQNKLQKFQQHIESFKKQYQELVESKEEQYEFVTDYLRELDVIYQEKRQVPLGNEERIQELLAACEGDPGNLTLKFELASQYVGSGLMEEGLVVLLDVRVGGFRL